MYAPNLKEFLKLSQKGNLICVYKEILADLETPVSAFLKISTGDYSYLLESVEGEAKIARYSFLASQPSLVFKSRGALVEIIKGSMHKRFVAKQTPLEEIKKIMKAYKFVPQEGLPRFCGGFVGYIGYDMVRFFEPCLEKSKQDLVDYLRLPDAVLVLTDTLLVFDHLRHKIKIICCVHLTKNSLGYKIKAYNEAVRKIEKIIKQLKSKTVLKTNYKKSLHLKIESNFTRQQFQNAVRKAKEYIRRGDVIQVVLSQRFKARLNNAPFDIYRSLRSINPSAYMYYLKFKDCTLVGSSPELLVRCEDGVVETRPIAGTRPRGKPEALDLKLEKDLLRDKKERAEHIMLVDLGRNDLGRVCKFGSVETPEFMRIERYSHVMHIVSSIVGKLAKRKDIYDCLKAAFPAGTVTGSPKIRAMEIIDQLEGTLRGPYAGCVGYFSFSGNLDTCITIRTIIIKDKTAYIQAGAGIVADSKPEKEYEETINKAKAQIEAIRQVK